MTSEASAAYEAKDWAKSGALYEEPVQANPETPRLWFRLGPSLQQLGQLDRALDGTKLKRQLQFFPLGPDKVRQFSQGSTDGGKTWTVEYDFTYIRKK